MPSETQREGRERLLNMLQELKPQYHPLKSLLLLSGTTEDDKVRLDCHRTIAEYIEPKLKSVEVKVEGHVDNTLRVRLLGDNGPALDGPTPAERRRLIEQQAQVESYEQNQVVHEAEIVELSADRPKVAGMNKQNHDI